MKFIYPAIFRKTPEGTYEGHFPDLEDCHVCGDTLEDAVEHANEAANSWISAELLEEECLLPPVTDLSDILLNEGETVRNICVTIRFYEGWDE